MSPRQLLRYSLVLFLFFPFVVLVYEFRIVELPELSELWWAFKNSFFQAFFSAFFSLILGIWAAQGLLTLARSRWAWGRPILDILCLLPNFLPPLFVLLAILNAVDPFPMGVIGIVIVHTLMNFGLVAVLVAGLIETKIGAMAELAYVEGASRWLFVRKGLLPYLKKDLFLLGLFVFVICFSSFSVPLIVGGGKGTTLEVLIYEKIRLSGDWGSAVMIAFLQSVFIFGLSLIAGRGQSSSESRPSNLNILSGYSGIYIVLLVSLIYMWGYVEGFIEGLPQISTLYELQSALIWNFLGSLSMGLITGALCFGGLMLIAYCWPKFWFGKILSGYVAPSTSLACFCLLLLGPNEGFYPFIKIPIALTLLSLTSLFRMGWDGELQRLESQITVAYSLGATPAQTFREVLLPQMAPRAGILAGLASVWACGDFAVSRILGHRDLTLAMTTESLMSGYRIHQAIVLSSLVLLVGIICFFIFAGGARVLSRKLNP
ncbi:ABC transporter permease [Bdellovibrio sp. HCB2-146]|uniref:ABC transporter permease n=1 Tax=Bdellovibrio sp. HCB2-146 TaxID=3394362 RepID=UPI0039BC3525